MGLEQVVEDVLTRGRSEADEIRQATLAERERILQDARAEGAKILDRRGQEAREEAERARIQALARAELEGKKIILSAQKELLDQVYAAALDGIPRLAEGEGLLRALLQTHEKEWKDGKVYTNARDADLVRSIIGPRFAGTIDCVGGVVIESADGTRRTDLRFETLLAEVWRDSIREVAEVLWPSP
jgi:V/A-type H+/Na+-transporting ATPase subunit E